MAWILLAKVAGLQKRYTMNAKELNDIIAGREAIAQRECEGTWEVLVYDGDDIVERVGGLDYATVCDADCEIQ